MLAPDKIVHLKGGAIVLLACGALAFGLLYLGVHPLAVVLINAGLAAGASVEASQQADNRRAAATGVLKPHEVSIADLVASAAPCWAGAAAVELLHMLGRLPIWLG